MEKGSVEGAYWSVWLLILMVKLVDNWLKIVKKLKPVAHEAEEMKEWMWQEQRNDKDV